MNLPLFVRKFVIDAVETFLGALFAMNIAIPGTIEEGAAIGLAVGAAAIAAAVSAARRAVPGFMAALKAALAVEEE